MENKSVPRGIMVISGGLLLLGIIYLSYGLIGRVSFTGKTSTIGQAYLIVAGMAAIVLAYGVFKQNEIARKITILISFLLSVFGPMKSLGHMLCIGNLDSVGIFTHLVELILFVSPAIYLIRAAIRKSFE